MSVCIELILKIVVICTKHAHFVQTMCMTYTIADAKQKPDIACIQNVIGKDLVFSGFSAFELSIRRYK